MQSSIQKKIQRAEALLQFSGAHRLPIILQAEMAECGLACLGMVAGFHGYDIDLAHLRSRYGLSPRGANLKYIIDIATKMHFAPRALKGELEDLAQASLPCIVHWDLNHFVVLKSVHRNKFTLHDPAQGERTLSANEFSQHFTGIILELTPTAEFKLCEEKSQLKITNLWTKIVGLKRSLLQVIFLSLLLQVFSLVSPFYMQTVVDDVLLRSDANLLKVLAIGFLLVLLIQVGTTALRDIVVLRMSNCLGMQISTNLFRHLIRLPLEYFSKRHMGDVVSRFGSLNKVRDILTSTLTTAFIDGLMAIITLGVMFFYNIQLACIVLSVVVLYGVLRWIFYKPLKALTEESLVASAKESSHFMESVRAIQTIKLFQRENDRQNQWQNRLAASMNKSIAIANWNVGYGAINGLLFGIENLLIVYFAANSVMDGAMSLGMLYAFMSYQGRFVGSMDSLISKFIEYKMLNVHLNRLADIAFSTVENIDDNQQWEPESQDNVISIESAKQKKVNGKIEVKNLSYRYSDQEPYIFKNLDFVIHPGETVAITGPSGCGKTTLLKCLMGLIQPTEGDVFIDDQPLNKHISYRSQIAGVMQEDQLLSGDIIENIACFSPVIDMQRVMLSAQIACIHNDILQMPMHYHTLVGDMGSTLSGGQKQRLILARAIYRDPKILFMDEATSHLDVNNESLVNSNICQLNITRVFVAHRPETVKTAGRLIELMWHGAA